jgi:uncharacterized membrane protein YdjX (TVP38/TMEM64 family)/endonuclease/exonuclease/phosphatase family metal-dependent hydrolase
MAQLRKLARITRRIPLFTLAVAGGTLVWLAGGPQRIQDQLLGRRSWLTDWADSHTIVAPLVYIACYVALMNLLWIPSWICTIVGGMLFGVYFGTVYALVGATLGAMSVFQLTRAGFAGLTTRAGPYLRALETGFRAEAFNYITFLRLVPIVPFTAVNIASAVLVVPLRTFVLATIAGIAPSVVIYASLGNGIARLPHEEAVFGAGLLLRPSIAGPLMGIGLLALAPVAYRRWLIPRATAKGNLLRCITEPAMLTDFQLALDLQRIYAKEHLTRPLSGDGMHHLRILTWNIGRGYHPARIADALEQLRPDVACLQEVDCGNQRTGSVDVLDFLAKRTQTLGLFGIEFLELASPIRSVRRAGGGAIGNAILSRFNPHACFRIELPQSVDWEHDADNPQLPGFVRRRIAREPRVGRRFGVGIEITIGQMRLAICSLHLEDKVGGIRGRWSQYHAAVQAMNSRGDGETVRVIAGDLNTFDSRFVRVFTGERDSTALGKPSGITEAEWWQTSLLPAVGYADPFPPTAYTFKVAPFFWGKLDWITAHGAAVCDFGMGPYSTSDHRPIWLELKVDESKQAFP